MSPVINLLAIETSGKSCSIAVWIAEKRLEDTRIVDRMHNEVLLEMLDKMFVDNNIAIEVIDAIAFGAGPGSFTGVRVGAAVAQSLALVAGASIIPVPSSKALLQVLRSEASEVVTSIRSRRDKYYLSGYRREDDEWKVIYPDALFEEWPSQYFDSSWVCIGEKPSWEGEAPIPKFITTEPVNASHVGTVGLLEYRAGRGKTPAEGLPLYVSGDNPWTSLKQK